MERLRTSPPEAEGQENSLPLRLAGRIYIYIYIYIHTYYICRFVVCSGCTISLRRDSLPLRLAGRRKLGLGTLLTSPVLLSLMLSLLLLVLWLLLVSLLLLVVVVVVVVATVWLIVLLSLLAWYLGKSWNSRIACSGTPQCYVSGSCHQSWARHIGQGHMHARLHAQPTYKHALTHAWPQANYVCAHMFYA